MGFGNLGITEIAVIAVLVLLFFGPERIPEMARTVGQLMREFRRGMNEIQRELQEVERSVSGEPGEPGEGPEREGPSRGRLEPGTWEERNADGATAGDGGESGPDAPTTPERYRPVRDAPPPPAAEPDEETEEED